MKGFKKDGKFRPTEKRSKSGLSKKDIAMIEKVHNDPKNIADMKKWKERMEADEGVLRCNECGATGLSEMAYKRDHGVQHHPTPKMLASRKKQSFDEFIENKYDTTNIMAKLDNDPKFAKELYDEYKKRDKETIEHDFTEKDLAELSTKERSIMEGDREEDDDEQVLDMERLDDIMEPVANIKTGEINWDKMEKAVEENIKYILKREKLPTDVTIHFQEVREETGQDEFEKTGEGESGHYQYMFNIYKNDKLRVQDIIYRGVAYGSLHIGELLDMEVDVYKH